MRLLAAIALIVLATTGCIGSGSSAGSNGSTNQRDGLPPPPTMTDVMITYTVTTCPPGAKCLAASNGDYHLASRHLTCWPGPAEGDYPDPAAACRALRHLVTKSDQTPASVCDCPGHPTGYVYPKAVGFYNSKRRTIPLDGCSLCGLPGIGADLKVLLPGAHG